MGEFFEEKREKDCCQEKNCFGRGGVDMDTLSGSLSILTQASIWIYILKGVAFTMIISVIAVVLGIVIGSVLALFRNYCNKGPYKILKWFAIVYIEVFRNTPLLLWIFICLVFCPCPDWPDNSGNEAFI